MAPSSLSIAGFTRRPAFGFALLVVALLAAAGASAALLVDYLRPLPVFCDGGGGCEDVKHTVFAHVGELPTPALGVGAFALLGLLASLRGERSRRLLLGLATPVALVGLFLLGVQVRLGTFCEYCLVVDSAAVVAFGGAVHRAFVGWDPPRLRGALPVALAAAMGIPLAVGFSRPAPRVAAVLELPEPIAAEIARTPAGRATIVDFVDFECPHCRVTHDRLAPALEEHASRVRVVRRHVPLSRIHPHALDAARAGCCGDILGRGDAMADALFRADVDELTPEGCARIAASLGIDDEAFRRCVRDPSVDQRIEADVQTFRDVQGRGLPLLWFGREKIEGAQPAARLRRALEEAVARASS